MRQSLLPALLFFSILLLAGCAQTADQDTIKLGVILPLTGEAASYGNAGRSGVDLAIKEVNDAGGINGRMLEAIYEDDACTKQSVSAIQSLMDVKSVDAILGFVCSSAAGPAVPVAQENKMPVVIIAASAPALTAGDYIFRIYPSDSLQGKYQAEYLYNDLGKRKVAIVYVKNDWGQGLHDVFVQRFEELGGKVVADESVLQDQTDMRTVIMKVKASDPDAIVAPLYVVTGLAFVKQAKDAGIDVPMIGGDSFGTPDFYSKPEADGMMFTTANIATPDDFKKTIEDRGGTMNIITPLGYDAVKIYAQVMREAGTEKSAVKDALSKGAFSGISSPTISFDSNGDLNSAVFEVKTINNGDID